MPVVVRDRGLRLGGGIASLSASAGCGVASLSLSMGRASAACGGANDSRLVPEKSSFLIGDAIVGVLSAALVRVETPDAEPIVARPCIGPLPLWRTEIELPMTIGDSLASSSPPSCERTDEHTAARVADRPPLLRGVADRAVLRGVAEGAASCGRVDER